MTAGSPPAPYHSYISPVPPASDLGYLLALPHLLTRLNRDGAGKQMSIQRECSIRMTDSYVIAITAEKRTAPGIFGLRTHFLHNRYDAVSGGGNPGLPGISGVH